MSSKKNTKYTLPQETVPIYDVNRYFACPPNSKNWVHSVQYDDELDADTERRTKIITSLKKIKVAAQRTAEWFDERNGAITGSAIATALGMNHYEPQYTFIQGKLVNIPFRGEIPAYKGKKFETCSTMIYEYRMNVIVKEYGCVKHECGFLGASPDGIVDEYKLDGIHKTKLVGRMLEVKNVDSRKINMTSNNILDIIPEYYFPQPQLQMQCCHLDSCDFWQTNIQEYKDRTEFMNDTDPKEPFRSKTTGFEKGALIQLLPFGDIDGKGYMNMVYNHSKFIYPPKIEMSPYEYDQWVAHTISTYRENEIYTDYIVDKVIYWYLKEARCVTVKRDDKWFAKHLPTLEKIWGYVKFFRANEMQQKLFLDFIKYAEKKYSSKRDIEQRNEIVMDVVEKLYDVKNKNYKKIIADIRNEIEIATKPVSEENDFDGFNLS